MVPWGIMMPERSCQHELEGGKEESSFQQESCQNKQSHDSHKYNGYPALADYLLRAPSPNDASLSRSYYNKTREHPSVEEESIEADRINSTWTPLLAYSTAVIGCIQATRDFVSGRQGNYTGRSVGISEHVSTASAYDVFERSWRKKIEAHATLTRQAYKLLWTEVIQTHSTGSRMDTTTPDQGPPSYEQTMSTPRAGTGELPLDTSEILLNAIRTLKYNERKWRCWWNSLTEVRPDLNAEEARNLQEKFFAVRRSVCGVDGGMREVAAYLQGVEHGARNQTRTSKASWGKQTSTITQKQRRTKHNSKQSRLEEKQNTKAVSVGKICSGMISWISRPFSSAVKNDRRSGQHGRAPDEVPMIEETDLGKEKIVTEHAEVSEKY